MPTKQGSIDLVNDPVAQQLLHSSIPARLAYNWTDGTPRVIPVAFHWNGQQIVIGTPSSAPKLKALHDGVKVAFTIDSDTLPYKVMLIRGSVTVNIIDGVPSEYSAAAEQLLGKEQGKGWIANYSSLFPQSARISVQPEWVGIIDYETRFPNWLEEAMERKASS